MNDQDIERVSKALASMMLAAVDSHGSNGEVAQLKAKVEELEGEIRTATMKLNASLGHAPDADYGLAGACVEAGNRLSEMELAEMRIQSVHNNAPMAHTLEGGFADLVQWVLDQQSKPDAPPKKVHLGPAYPGGLESEKFDSPEQAIGFILSGKRGKSNAKTS